MIQKKPAPGHSRPKDGVASLAYDPGVGTGFRKSTPSGSTRGIMLKQKAGAPF
jgi:hypothetical protein